MLAMRLLRIAPALGIAAAVLLGCDSSSSQAVAATGPVAGKVRMFSLHATPRPVPALAFQNDSGKTVRLSDFRGKVVVLNVWATWCAPCREEMPTLDRLQAQLGGPKFEVVALSVDHDGSRGVQQFFRDIGVKYLRWYIDPTPRTLDELKVFGLPATLLIDPKGLELGRLLGATQWDSPEMVRFLRGMIERNTAAQTTTTRLGTQTVR